MNPTRKSIIFLHGWLGNPYSFGHLPVIFKAEGHDVLPIFKHYDTRSRHLTLEELADAFEVEFKATVKDPARQHIVVAHSMGGLLIRTWMLRHYFNQGIKPPIEKVIECGSPRNGVPGNAIGHFLVRHNILPGAKLVGQMKTAQSFIWNLAASELEFASQWPPTIAIASALKKTALFAHFIGGRESDNIVPTALSNPNPIFGKLGQRTTMMPSRLFHVFSNWTHNGSRGILGHIRSDANGNPISPKDEVLIALKDYINTPSLDGMQTHGAPASEVLTRTFILVRTPPSSVTLNIKNLRIKIDSTQTLRPNSCTPQEGLGLFELPTPSLHRQPRRFILMTGKKTWADKEFGLEDGIRPGEFIYLDLAT